MTSTTSAEREAACSCGQLKLHLKGEPVLVSSCHCLAGQRRTGSLFGVQAFFRLDQLAAVEGEHHIFSRQADSGNTVTCRFCPQCGSTMYWERPSLPGMVTVAVGAFADKDFPAPGRTVWTETKHAWLNFPGHITQHRKNP